MRFASLGSGSRGNALVVDVGDTRVLVDCGFSTRMTVQRLAHLGVDPDSIDAVLVTHEHGDHVGGVARFSARFSAPVYLTHGTHASLRVAQAQSADFRLVDSHQVFSIGGVEVQPYPVPHDAREPVQFVFSDGNRKLGVLTDCGAVTVHVAGVLQRCDALVIECNHDQNLLASSSYPPALKQRIRSDYGHLSNAQAASLLSQVERSRLQHVVAAHLSEENNRPELAASALAEALNCTADWIGVADQVGGFDWRQVT